MLDDLTHCERRPSPRSLRELALRLERRLDSRQPPLFPLGFDPRDVRPEVTAWDYKPMVDGGMEAADARSLPGLEGIWR